MERQHAQVTISSVPATGSVLLAHPLTTGALSAAGCRLKLLHSQLCLSMPER